MIILTRERTPPPCRIPMARRTFTSTTSRTAVRRNPHRHQRQCRRCSVFPIQCRCRPHRPRLCMHLTQHIHTPPASSVLRCSLLSSATSAADGNISQPEGGEERRENTREEAREEARAAEARATEASARAAEASASTSGTTAKIASKAEGTTGILKIFHRVRDNVLPSTRLWYRLRV